MILEFKKVVKKNLIDETNLKIFEKDIIEILSNDFESTSDILKHIIGFKKITSGKIFLFNHEQSSDITLAKRSIGYTEGLKSKGNTTAINYLLNTASFFKGNYKNNIESLLDRFNFDPSKRIKSLSEDEKINLSIINILFYEPKLIILNNILDKCSDSNLKKIINLLYEYRLKGAAIISAASKSYLNSFIYIYKDKTLIRDIDIEQYNKVSIKGTKYLPKDFSNAIRLKINEDSIDAIFKNSAEDIKKKLEKKYEIISIEKPSVGDLNE